MPSIVVAYVFYDSHMFLFMAYGVALNTTSFQEYHCACANLHGLRKVPRHRRASLLVTLAGHPQHDRTAEVYRPKGAMPTL